MSPHPSVLAAFRGGATPTYVGDRPAELRWTREPGTHQVGWFDRAKPTVSKRAASATPEAFARALVELARNSWRNRDQA